MPLKKAWLLDGDWNLFSITAKLVIEIFLLLVIEFSKGACNMFLESFWQMLLLGELMRIKNYNHLKGFQLPNYWSSKNFNRLTYGNQKSTLVAIWKGLIIGWWPKPFAPILWQSKKNSITISKHMINRWLKTNSITNPMVIKFISSHHMNGAT